ncbi:MAG: hypothetical protein ABSB35_10450 [Bryobacteraceae bacterium]
MTPYLSIVVTARNDDHGGDLLGRMQTFLNSLLSQCRRHELSAELIIVEWNPPPDRPPLAEALDWPDDGNFCQVRIIEVDSGLHRKFAHSAELPLYQMIAKNAGIRRARGEFVLATNIDILFSDELMRFISGRNLRPGKMYRIDRHDVMSNVPLNASVDEQLAYCRSHLIRVNAREGTFRLGKDGARVLEKHDIVKPNSGLNLGSGWFPPEKQGDEIFRWVTNDAEVIVEPSDDAGRVILIEIEPGPGVGHETFLLEVRDQDGTPFSASVDERSLLSFPVPDSNGGAVHFRLHTSVGGSRIASDPRELNFRVFRCEVSVKATEYGLKVPRKSFGLVSRLMGRVSGPPAESINRHRLVPTGGYSLWGDGWYGVESANGESFRWMKHRGAIALFRPPGAGNSASLLVEAGPALGFGRFQLDVRDQWGSLLATGKVKRRGSVAVPLHDGDGAQVIVLSVQGGGEPETVAGDSRTLAVRLFRCDWTGTDNVLSVARVPIEVGFPGSGVWCGQGFDRIGGDGHQSSASFTEAELVVRVPDGGNHTLTIEARLGPDAQPDPCDLVVEDTSGRRLCSARIMEKQELRVQNDLLPGDLYAFRLRSSQPALLTSVIWSAGPGDDPIRIPIKRTAGAGVHDTTPAYLHTNGCGDFTLMARDHWMDLRGYPEFDMFSMNLDALFCYAAHHGNVFEEVLKDPMRIYHIEHGIGSGWTPEGQRKLFARVAAKGLSSLDYQEVLHCARIMNRFGAPMIFNHTDWGLEREELKETTPHLLHKRAHRQA